MEKKYSLRKNKDFRYAYKRGQSLVSPLLVMIFYKRSKHYKIQDNKKQVYTSSMHTSSGCISADYPSRIGFSINKRFGNAVERNRIKRQLRDIISKRTGLLRNGYDIIFIVKKNTKGVKYVDLEREIDKLLKRGRLLLGENEEK